MKTTPDNYFRTYDPEVGRYTQSDPIGLTGGVNTYGYVGANPIDWIDIDGLERKPGRTPPGAWPKLPNNISGKKPQWNSEGYWEGKKGKFTWDDRSHGTGIDRGDGAQGGHWDDESSNNRYDPDGSPLPGSDDYKNSMCESDSCTKTVGAAALGGLVAYGLYRCGRMIPSMFPPLWWTAPANILTP